MVQGTTNFLERLQDSNQPIEAVMATKSNKVINEFVQSPTSDIVTGVGSSADQMSQTIQPSGMDTILENQNESNIFGNQTIVDGQSTVAPSFGERAINGHRSTKSATKSSSKGRQIRNQTAYVTGR